MKFDLYEYTGVIVPGSVLVVTLALIFPELLPSITSTLSLGDLGLMLILAYIAGHFVQAGGNAWEFIVWKCLGGWPTETVMSASSNLLNQEQRKRLQLKLAADFGELAAHVTSLPWKEAAQPWERNSSTLERTDSTLDTSGSSLWRGSRLIPVGLASNSGRVCD